MQQIHKLAHATIDICARSKQVVCWLVSVRFVCRSASLQQITVVESELKSPHAWRDESVDFQFARQLSESPPQIVVTGA